MKGLIKKANPTNDNAIAISGDLATSPRLRESFIRFGVAFSVFPSLSISFNHLSITKKNEAFLV